MVELGGSRFAATRSAGGGVTGFEAKEEEVWVARQLLPVLGRAVTTLWLGLWFGQPSNLEPGVLESRKYVAQRPAPEPHFVFAAALHPAILKQLGLEVVA